jgi:glycosyltransferase involved in cell wall biosynthesis
MFFGTLQPTEPRLRAFMQAQGVECFSANCRRRTEYPAGLLRFATFLRRNRIDILHTHLFDPSVIGLLAGVLAGTRLRVMTRHYSDYHTRIHKAWHVRLDRLCTRLAHGVIAVSRHTAEHLVQVEGAPAEKVHIIVNGIDFDRVHRPSHEERESLRRELGTDGTYFVLVAARLHPEKGYEHLFDALPLLKSRLDRPLTLLVAGTGPFEAEYRERVRALGCRDVVRFLGFRHDVPTLMAAADLFVLPSVAEAFGLVLAEALYLGVPVVATRVGGIPEIVDDGIDGVLVPPADSGVLAEAIAGLLRDPERRRRLAGAGREKVVARFRFENMVRSYEALYERLVAA